MASMKILINEKNFWQNCNCTFVSTSKESTIFQSPVFGEWISFPNTVIPNTYFKIGGAEYG